MTWKPLTSVEELEAVLAESHQQPVVIFKHSTSCSISATAKARLERQWDSAGLQGLTPYYLDLLRYRSVSNEVAQRLDVIHESPQLLLIQESKCVYDASHLSIRLDAVSQAAKQQA